MSDDCDDCTVLLEEMLTLQTENAALKQERDRYKAALEKGIRFIQEHYCAETPERLEIIREFRSALSEATSPSEVKL